MGIREIHEGIQELMQDDGKSKYIELHIWSEQLSEIAGLIMNVLIVLMSVFVTLIVALEVFYINVPAFRSTLDELSEHNLRVGRVAGIVFRDARLAILRASAMDTGKSTNVEYLRIKSKSLFIVFFVIGLVLNFDIVILGIKSVFGVLFPNIQ